MNIAIEKFIKRMGITCEIEPGERFYTHRTSLPGICFGVYAYYEGKKTYEQHHCYSMRRSGEMNYEGGNEVIGVREGIFGYLGADKEIHQYFEYKTRNKAKEFLADY